MPYERTGYAPWSLTREAGVESATVDGTIQIPQYGQPIIDIGFVDEKGNWKGLASNDDEFFNFQTDVGIANNGEVVSIDTINMFKHDILMFAFQTNSGGNYYFELLLSGTETGDDSYFNLKPIITNAKARATMRTDSSTDALDDVFNDQETSLTADKWYVYKINDCKGFKLVMRITNQSGSAATMQQAIMRIV